MPEKRSRGAMEDDDDTKPVRNFARPFVGFKIPEPPSRSAGVEEASDEDEDQVVWKNAPYRLSTQRISTYC